MQYKKKSILKLIIEYIIMENTLFLTKIESTLGYDTYTTINNRLRKFYYK